jgi:hypothetical protein
MMQQPGLQPVDCPNFTTCRTALGIEPSQDFDLQNWQGLLQTNRGQLAVRMLSSRGCPQAVEDFGLPAKLAALQTQLQELEALLEAYEGVYIAPEACELHVYNVKRPRGVYWYRKLTASQPIFASAEGSRNVRTIHLSHSDDPRSIEAGLGIERRNRLMKVRTQLALAKAAMQTATEVMAE